MNGTDELTPICEQATSMDDNEAWAVLSEAIPTALGQGVADRAFRRSTWSTAEPWYHTDDVDRYAKAIYPLVRDTLRAGGRLDAEFLERAWALRPGEAEVTRRSP